MGSAASSLSASDDGAASSPPFIFDPLASSAESTNVAPPPLPALPADLEPAAAPRIADACRVRIAEVEAHRDDLLAGGANFASRCDELRDTLQNDALVTLLQNGTAAGAKDKTEENAAALTQLAAALHAGGRATDALSTVDRAIELGAADDEALFVAHTARGLILRELQEDQSAADAAFAAALELSAKAKVEPPKRVIARAKRLGGACKEALDLAG